jgi:hypothetical protein
MERVKTETFIVGEQFLPYAINGDATGLEDNEELEFDAFSLAPYTNPPTGYRFSHWDTENDRDEFALCEVTGLRGACQPLIAVYFHKDA